MNVLHVYRAYYPESTGGIEQAIAQICQATNELKVTNRVYTLTSNGQYQYERPECEVFAGKRLFEVASCDIGLAKGFKSLVEWADVIHIHFPWPFADALYWLAQKKKPLVVTYHSDIVRQKYLLSLYIPLKQYLMRRAQVICPTSSNYLESSEFLQNYREKCRVIPLGTKATVRSKKANEMNSETDLPEKFILFVGVLRYYKGLRYLLKSVQNLGLNLVIAGDGPERNALQRYAKNLGLSNVRFLGWVTDETKFELLARCEFFVFPSCERSEAFGMSLVEAAMMGKPMVSCELSTGTSYINQHQETGLVVPPKNVPALQQAITDLWGNNELINRYGLNARSRYEQLFSAGTLGSSYTSVYEQAIALEPATAS